MARSLLSRNVLLIFKSSMGFYFNALTGLQLGCGSSRGCNCQVNVLGIKKASEETFLLTLNELTT